MGHAAVDTLSYAKRLKDAGFDDKQAETITSLISEAEQNQEDHLATKGDIKELVLKLENGLRETDSRIKELELRMTIKFGAMMAANIAILAALIKFGH